jgi:hypothetical protein
MDETNVEEEIVDNTEDNAPVTEEQETGETAEIEAADDHADDGGAGGTTSTPKSRAEAQINRLKKEIEELKKGQGQAPALNNDLINRTYLTASGYKDRDVQDEVLRLAGKFGLTVDQALEDNDIKTRAAALVKQKEVAQASARPTGKGGATKKDAQWYVDHNVMPDDPKLVTEVWAIKAAQEQR